MIETWLLGYVGPKAAKILAKIIFWLLVVAVVVVVLSVAKCSYDQRAKTEIKLGKGQTGAAFKSGKAAVDIIGNRQDAEESGATNVQEAQDAINNASDAGAVTDAGLAGLHRVRRQGDDSGKRRPVQ